MLGVVIHVLLTDYCLSSIQINHLYLSWGNLGKYFNLWLFSIAFGGAA